MEIPNEIINQSQRTTAKSKSPDPSTSRKYDYESGREYLRKPQHEIQRELEAMRQRQLRSKDEPRKVPYDAHMQEYFDSLQDDEDKVIEYGDARVAFYLIWKSLIKSDEIYLDPADAENIRQFVKWMIRDESCTLDLDKGILMIGTQGCGKTTLMKAGRIFLNRYTKRTYEVVRVNDIVLQIDEHKSLSSIKPYFKGHWCFDDIGQMEENVVAYSKGNVVEMLINRRAETGYHTLGTTNLSPDQMSERYGRVVSSRMNQMFNPMIFESKVDCRKLK